MKTMLALGLATVLLFLCTACGTGASSSSPLAEALDLPHADPAGNTIKLDRRPTKIISLSPFITQTLLDLDCGDRLIGMDTESAKVAGANNSLHTFDARHPDLGSMLFLTPDLLLVSALNTEEDASALDFFMGIGIPVAVLPTGVSIENIYQNIAFLGQITDTEQKAAEMCESLQAEIETIAAIGRTVQHKKTVYFETEAYPYCASFGKAVYLDEMIGLIGATNAVGGSGWQSIAPETAVALNPDVIFTSVDYLDDPVNEILTRYGWSHITAVQTQQVYHLNTQQATVSSEAIVPLLKEMAKAVYPELYADIP